jgi:hypothetical protein
MAHYSRCGYPVELLQEHYLRANGYSQTKALSKSQKEDKPNRPVLVTTFNPNNPDLKAMLLRHWNIIKYFTDCTRTFKHAPIIGFRRSRNLKDILVNAVVRYPAEPPKPAWWLSRPGICYRLGKCTYCYFLTKKLEFTSFVTGLESKVKNIPKPLFISCEMSNVIYLITCKKCGIQYVGETGRKL